MKRNDYVFLTGGLGNQLFQLAFGLAWAEADLVLDFQHGNPRKSIEGTPDLFEFRLPHRTKLSNQQNSKQIEKVLGYNLRIGVVPNRIERNRTFLRLVKIASTILISIHLKSLVVPVVAKGVGYFNYVSKTNRSRFFIGYFQSYKWLMSNKVIREFRELQIKNPSERLISLKQELAAEPTLILHLRLGDYLSEPAFGTISKDYIEAGIDNVFKSAGIMRIWGFSDQPDLAKHLLGDAMESEIRWIGPEDLSSAETLELMRGGSGYILANSTFSWWAAMLRRSVTAPVIAPKPWFKNLPEPPDLIPHEWIRVKAFGPN